MKLIFETACSTTDARDHPQGRAPGSEQHLKRGGLMLSGCPALGGGGKRRATPAQPLAGGGAHSPRPVAAPRPSLPGAGALSPSPGRRKDIALLPSRRAPRPAPAPGPGAAMAVAAAGGRGAD